MDVVLTCFKFHHSHVLLENKKKIKSGLKELLGNQIFVDSITVRTSDKKKMDYRVSKFCEMVDGVLTSP